MIGVPMARRSEFYKGRRKRRNYALIPGIILMLLFGAGVVLFYSTQKYAIIADDGVSIELPLLTGKTTANNETGREAAEFEQVNVEIRFEEADYSGVPATAGRRVQPVRAIFVPYDDVNPERVHEYANRLSSGNALMLEVKREDGYLAWYSSAPLAFSYGLNMNTVESTDTLVSILSSIPFWVPAARTAACTTQPVPITLTERTSGWIRTTTRCGIIRHNWCVSCGSWVLTRSFWIM